MVKDIKLASLTIPVDNDTLPHSMWSKNIDLYGYPSSVLECNLKLNAEYLQNALGMEEYGNCTGQKENFSEVACHCEPVRTLAWQSVPLFTFR